MQLSGQRAIIISAIGFFVVGLLIGWLVIGWWLWPVQYYDADPFDLREGHRSAYLTMVADSYALTGDVGVARSRLEGWPQDELAAGLSDLTAAAIQQGRTGDAQRVSALANIVGLQLTPAATPEEEPGNGKPIWSTILAVCGIVLLAALFVAGLALAWSYWQKRGAGQLPRAVATSEDALDLTEEFGIAGPTFLRTFTTAYNLGDDGYDACFPIETPAGEFLGECGVGISEVLGSGEPSLVTALEMWLFDKSDIRTVTKVLMSPFAFQDAELREQLAPKGEAVLVEPGKTIALDTAALLVRGVITDVAYGVGDGPEQSHFVRLAVELTAQTKDG